MCGPSRITRCAPGTRSLMPLTRSTDAARRPCRRATVVDAGDVRQLRARVVAADRTPAVGERKRVECEQAFAARRRRRGAPAAVPSAARREPPLERHLRARPAMPERLRVRGARSPSPRGRRRGRCTRRTASAPGPGGGSRDASRPSPPSEHAGEVERPVVALGDLVGEARHRRRRRGARAPAKAREDVLGGAAARGSGTCSQAPASSAIGVSRTSVTARKYCASRRVRCAPTWLECADDPA